MQLGNMLSELRQDKHLTQEELGKRLGMSRSTIGSYEQDQSQPPYDVLLKLAELYDVSTDYLLGRTRIPNERAASVLLQDKAVERVAASMLSMSRRHKEMILELSESFAELDKRRAQDPPEKAGE